MLYFPTEYFHKYSLAYINRPCVPIHLFRKTVTSSNSIDLIEYLLSSKIKVQQKCTKCLSNCAYECLTSLFNTVLCKKTLHTHLRAVNPVINTIIF